MLFSECRPEMKYVPLMCFKPTTLAVIRFQPGTRRDAQSRSNKGNQNYRPVNSTSRVSQTWQIWILRPPSWFPFAASIFAVVTFSGFLE